MPSTAHPLAQECFKLLAALLRASPAFRPSVAQLRFLMRWAFADLADSGGRQTLFALLKAILSRRVREVVEARPPLAAVAAQRSSLAPTATLVPQLRTAHCAASHPDHLTPLSTTLQPSTHHPRPLGRSTT